MVFRDGCVNCGLPCLGDSCPMLIRDIEYEDEDLFCSICDCEIEDFESESNDGLCYDCFDKIERGEDVWGSQL